MINNIEDYIRINKKSYWTLLGDDNIIGLFEPFKDAYSVDLDIKTICSTSVFPQVVRLLSGEQILLWDMKYWEIFDRYIKYMAVFDQNKDFEKIDLCKYNLSLMFFEFLVCKFDSHPIISYCIARDILRGNPIYYEVDEQTICPRFSSGEIKSVRGIARTYTLLHEMHHCLYKKNKELFKEDISTIRQIIDFLLHNDLKDLFNQNVDEQMESLIFQSMKDIMEGKDEILLEELACNYRAFIDIYAFNNVKANTSSLGDKEEYLTDVQEGIWFNLLLHSELNFVYYFWREHFKLFEMIKNSSSKSSIMEKDVDNLYKKLNQIRIKNLTYNQTIMRVIITHAIKKYNRYSVVSMISTSKMKEKFDDALEICKDMKVLQKIALRCDTLEKNTSFNLLQMIESRNMLMTWS